MQQLWSCLFSTDFADDFINIFLSFSGSKAAMRAYSKTSLTPFVVFAEHSTYANASTSWASCFPYSIWDNIIFINLLRKKWSFFPFSKLFQNLFIIPKINFRSNNNHWNIWCILTQLLMPLHNKNTFTICILFVLHYEKMLDWLLKNKPKIHECLDNLVV